MMYCRERFRGKTYLLIILLLLSAGILKGQEETSYTVHANIIYHFTKYIDWPDDRKSGDFIIGIVGETPLYETLKRSVSNKTMGNRKIIVKMLPALASSFNCHILFISEDKNKELRKIVATTANSSILIVTESDGSARKGACINFMLVDERLKLEINKNNIERRHLDIASELLKLGTPVK